MTVSYSRMLETIQSGSLAAVWGVDWRVAGGKVGDDFPAAGSIQGRGCGGLAQGGGRGGG